DRHGHSVDRHQHNAADEETRIDRLLVVLLWLTVKGLEKAGRVPIAGNEPPRNLEHAGAAHQQNGETRPYFRPKLAGARGILDRAGIGIERDSERLVDDVWHYRAEQPSIHDPPPFVPAKAGTQRS